MKKEGLYGMIILCLWACFLMLGALFFLLPVRALVQSGEPELKTAAPEEMADIPEDSDLAIEDVAERISRGIMGFRINYGPRLGAIKLNLQSVNQYLRANNFPPLSAEIPVMVRGGRAGFHLGTRVGWMRYEGSQKATYQAEGVYRKSEIDIFWRGVVYENNVYTAGHSDLILGGLLGRGAASLNFVFSRPRELELDSGHQIQLEYKFWALQPFISLQQRISRLVDAELMVGYFLTSSGQDWQFAGQKIETPFSDLRGPVLTTGINIGF